MTTKLYYTAPTIAPILRPRLRHCASQYCSSLITGILCFLILAPFWLSAQPLSSPILRLDGACMDGSLANTQLLTAKGEYVAHPTTLTGIAVLTIDPTATPTFRYRYPYGTQPREAEYIHIMQYDVMHDSLIVIASVRWDTAASRITHFPLHADSARFGAAPVRLYEVTLPQPVIVDSVFYLAGTYNNNRLANRSFRSLPTAYAFLYPQQPTMRPCSNGQEIMIADMSDTTALWFNTSPELYGLYLPRFQQAIVDARPFVDGTGTVTPSGSLSIHANHTFHAQPNHGYRFLRWSDGNTTNPRTLHLTSDTSLVAIFEEMTTQTIAPTTNHVLSQDTVAQHSPHALFSLRTINEPTGVTISFAEQLHSGTLSITNHQGLEVVQRVIQLVPRQLTFRLIPGSYFITFQTEEDKYTQKVVIKE